LAVDGGRAERRVANQKSIIKGKGGMTKAYLPCSFSYRVNSKTAGRRSVLFLAFYPVLSRKLAQELLKTMKEREGVTIEIFPRAGLKLQLSRGE
jgi:hypothetical protein